jgi:hypothetical protein
MPLYDLRNTDTLEEKEVNMSYASLQDYLKDNPNWKKIIKSTGGLIPESGDMFSKTPDSWKDLAKAIKKGSGRGNSIKV